MSNQKMVLSTSWIFAMFNYLYCDVIGIMDPNLLKQFITGTVGGIEFSQRFLLGSSILMEIPIAMILLSRVLAYKANRVLNIIAGFIMTIVQLASVFLGSGSTIYYLFFSVIEISCTSFIIWYAWKWSQPQSVVQAA